MRHTETTSTSTQISSRTSLSRMSDFRENKGEREAVGEGLIDERRLTWWFCVSLLAAVSLTSDAELMLCYAGFKE